MPHYNQSSNLWGPQGARAEGRQGGGSPGDINGNGTCTGGAACTFAVLPLAMMGIGGACTGGTYTGKPREGEGGW